MHRNRQEPGDPVTRGYTMDDFHAEMKRRSVYERPSPRMRVRAPTQDRCTTCGGTEFVDAIDNEGHPYRGCKRCRIVDPEAVNTKAHGNKVLKIVPCGVHPLHLVKRRANGAHSGCPMCEMQIEDLCRSLSGESAPKDQPTPRDHRPRINREMTMIVGCTCGWRTPPDTTDSDTAWIEHVTVAR